MLDFYGLHDIIFSHFSPFLFLLNILVQISGRLFSDSGPRRSTRLSSEASINANANAAVLSGNGTSNSSKHLGVSKLSPMAFRTMTRKGQSWANENIDEGDETLYVTSLLYQFILDMWKCYPS